MASPTSLSGEPVVSLRLAGGLGDHLLGMRVLPFIRRRYPNHDINVFSDAAGHEVPSAAASMSPFVSRVTPVFRRRGSHAVTTQELETIRHEDLAAMLAGDIFIDGAGSLMFTNASVLLNVPVVEMLAQRTQLVISPSAKDDAAKRLENYRNTRYVGMNLTKFGGIQNGRMRSIVTFLLKQLLMRPDVVVLNIYTSTYEFAHLPERLRARRHQAVIDDARGSRDLCDISERVVPCVDLPLQTVAALMKRCSYFIGVDNGVKHLAWALDIPLTFLGPSRPSLYHVIRWMPDYNRLLTFDCSKTQLDAHVATANAAIAQSDSPEHQLERRCV